MDPGAVSAGYTISIHAPYKGCNPYFLVSPSWWRFQSMHPIKDATEIASYLEKYDFISIHAPYKGCNI